MSRYFRLSRGMSSTVVPTYPMPTSLARGSGGRSSVSGVVATVFGATGFIGRYVVNALGRIGSQVFCPWRGNELYYRHLKVMGDLGQIIPMEFELRDRESVYQACRNSNVVVNLTGKHYHTRNYTIEQSTVEAAQVIAETARDLGIEQFIQISMANLSEDSESELIRAKVKAEKIVRDLIPTSTIIRCTDVFGPEDRFLTKIMYKVLNIPVYPLVEFGSHKVQPISVHDVANMFALAIKDPEAFMGKTLKIGGRTVMTSKELFEWAVAETGYESDISCIDLPRFAAKAVFYPWTVRMPFINPTPKLGVGDVAEEIRDNTIDPVLPDEVTLEDINYVPHEVTGTFGSDSLLEFMGRRTYRGRLLRR